MGVVELVIVVDFAVDMVDAVVKMVAVIGVIEEIGLES